MNLLFIRSFPRGALCILILWNISFATGQPVTVPKLTIRDRLLAEQLAAYCRNVSNRVISLSVETYGDTYEYHVSGIDFSEHINRSPPRRWGLWRNRLLLFYASVDISNLVSTDQTISFGSLTEYARSILPSTHGAAIAMHGLEWTFALRNGREEWLWTSEGYDSRDFPQPQ